MGHHRLDLTSQTEKQVHVSENLFHFISYLKNILRGRKMPMPLKNVGEQWYLINVKRNPEAHPHSSWRKLRSLCTLPQDPKQLIFPSSSRHIYNKPLAELTSRLGTGCIEQTKLLKGCSYWFIYSCSVQTHGVSGLLPRLGCTYVGTHEDLS